MKTLRKASIDDAAAILKIYTPFVIKTPITFELEVPEPKCFAERMQGIMGRYPYLVCEQEGVISGYAYATPLRERKAYQWCAELSVYVDPKAAGQGVGLALYAALMDMLKQQNVHSVYGCVTIPNQASEALHARMGFSSSGIFRKSGYKLGAWHDVAWFVRHLLQHKTDPDPFIPFERLDTAVVEALLRERERRLNRERY